jgi:beta-lactamase regulating signal transducer with metallopeptidase domain
MSADFLARGYSTFIAYLAEPAARSFLIGCAAAAALTAFRVKRVGARLLVWTAVLCAALAMPFLGALLPHVTVKVPAIPLVANLQAKMNRAPAHVAQRQTNAPVFVLRDTKAATAASPALFASASTPTIEFASRKTIKEMDRKASRRDADSPAFSIASETPSIASAPTVHNASRGFAIPWTALFLAVYLLVAVILVARLIIGMLFSRRLDRAAQNIDASDDRGREALRLLRFRSCIAGLQTAPRLKESALLAVPATLGVHRSAILLPAGWRSWSEEQLDAVLAHEISHVARRDALTQLLSLIHRAIFWFNPLSWWLDRQLTDLAEQASDEAALAGGADRTRYAETLLAFFAQLAASRRRVWWQGVAMAKHERKAGSAERRVNRILAWNGAMSMKKSFAVAIIALAAPLIFLAASVHPFVAHAQDTAKPAAPAKPANIIAPGGPVAPALPDAPKGGVTGKVTGGVVASTIPSGPSTPGPSGGVLGSGPTAPAPSAGVFAPAMPPAPTGPLTIIPQRAVPASTPRAQIGPSELATTAPMAGYSALTPLASTAPIAPYSSYSPYASIAPIAPLAPQSSIAADDSARAQDTQAQLQAAQQAVQAAEQATQAARTEQLRAALKALAQAVQESDEADSAQVLAAQHAIEKASRIMEQGYTSQMQDVNAAMAEAKRDLQEAEAAQQEAQSFTINGGSYTIGGGPRYVIMTGNGESIEMSGDDEDLDHARELHKKLGKDLIWFERDEKSYVITDPDFIAKAKALFAPEDALSKQQDELSRQQDALSKQQDALSDQMDKVKVKVPDITPDLQRIKGELDALRNQDGATQSELGRLQSELGQLQSQVGRFQSDAGVQQSNIGRQQGELGRQQGELGRKQGELGRQQGEIARQASRQLRQMLDDAIAKGIAKPE